MPEGHPAELRQQLHGVRRRWATARRLRAFARWAALGAVVLLLVTVVDAALAPADTVLLGFGGAGLLAIAAFAVFEIWRIRHRPTDRQVARLVEERCPDLQDRVVTASAVADAPEAPYRTLLLRDAVERFRQIDPDQVVPSSQMWAALGSGLIAGAALILVGVFSLDAVGRAVWVAWLYAAPAEFALVVEPGDTQVGVGEAVTVRARLTGGSAWLVEGGVERSAATLRITDETGVRELSMAPDRGGWVSELTSIEEDLAYRVRLAGITSAQFRIDALVPPRVERVGVTYDYPAYTGLPSRVEEDGGDIYAPVGTDVRLRVQTDQPVASGTLRFDDGREIALDVAGGGVISPVLGIETDGSYRIELTTAEGLANVAPVDYFIRATTDRPPLVTVLRPGGDREITSLEEVTIEARAKDDYRVERLDLVYTVSGALERTLAFDVATGATVDGASTLYVEDLDVAPGDFIAYFVQAAGPDSAPQTRARSDIFFLEVRPFDNEYEEAQSQSGAGQAIQELGRLATVQKEIIVASWRLEPQPRSDSVDGDIRAVAEAQAELRAEVERAAGRGSGPTVGSVPGAADQASQNAAMSAALDAMGRAQQALEAYAVAGALPHEMTALNELLRAQAAIRRRQVSSQRGGGGAGTGAQEDLSALFDRELRRDQETNYETERQAGDQSTPDRSEVLARLRALAERQAELNQELEQREAEATEASRRELARLLREQQALRDEIDQMREQLGDPQSAGGQSEQASGGTPGQAADEMQRAMRELRRDNVEGARASGDRALEALRRLEAALGGGADDEQRLGELQSDARALADAQRDLARETEAAAEDRRSTAFGDELAERQEALADRVGDLGRELEALAGGEGGHPAAEARRAIEEDALEERMRAVAQRLGERVDATGPGEPVVVPALDEDAAEAAALAAALDEVAGALRVAATADEERRQLVADLETARALREALDALDVGPEASQPRAEGAAAGGSAEAGPLPDAPATGGAEGEGETAQSPTESGAGSSAGDGDTEARQALIDRLRAAPGLLDALRGQSPTIDGDLEPWARQWASGSAPGTDPARIDPAVWSTLRRHLDTALRQFEAERAAALAERDAAERLSPGVADRVPDRYRRLVDAYYRGLAESAARTGTPR